jgi:3-hydroxyisobutyrate dehydrogenase
LAPLNTTPHTLVSLIRAQFNCRRMAMEQKQPFPAGVGPDKVRLGFIGIGVMGLSMSGHLLNAGYKVSVYNRTLSKCEPLKAKGAVVCASPKEVAQNSDIVFTMVGYPADVQQVILGQDGILAGLREGCAVIDMTTSAPALAKEIFDAAGRKGVHAIDAPVSGGDIGARNGTLSIMIGGDRAVAEAVKPLFAVLGKNIQYLGSAGSGQHTKLVNQILIATNMIGVVEGLLYAQKAGLNPTEVIAAVGAGAAGSWSINNLGPLIIARNFDPGFFVEHFLKDMGMALAESARMGLALPGLALANQLYVAVKAQGHGRLGTHALMLALETLNGIRHA